MSETTYKGIDYGLGSSNVDKKTGIRYGVISHHDVGAAWYEGSEAYYGKPDGALCPSCGESATLPKDAEWGCMAKCENEECADFEEEFEVELPDCAEPISHFIDDKEYSAECSGDSGDIFIMKSPYYTRAQFCSPCAPGACYLTNPCDDGEKAYCFDHDMFEEQQAPYPVWRVDDDTPVLPDVDYYTASSDPQEHIESWDCERATVTTRSIPYNQNKINTYTR